METALTFVASLVVSLLCIPFSAFQRDRVANTIERMIVEALEGTHKNSTKAANDLAGTKPLIDRTQLGSLLSQALDVATAFPTAVLTAVAYLGLTGSDNLPATFLLLAAVAATLGLSWLASPKHLSWYLRLRVGKRGPGKYPQSLVPWLLITANLIGCGIAVYQLSVGQPASGA